MYNINRLHVAHVGHVALLPTFNITHIYHYLYVICQQITPSNLLNYKKTGVVKSRKNSVISDMSVMLFTLTALTTVLIIIKPLFIIGGFAL